MEITHKNSSETGFFLAEEGGKRMGFLAYEWANDAEFAILHTVVEDAFQGKGVARSLLNAAVSFARANGYKIQPICPFAEKVFARDASLDDVNANKR
jgi:hypothetical protein